MWKMKIIISSVSKWFYFWVFNVIMLVKSLAQSLAHNISSICSYCHSSQKKTPIMCSPFTNAIYHDRHSAPSHSLALAFFFILFLCLQLLRLSNDFFWFLASREDVEKRVCLLGSGRPGFESKLCSSLALWAWVGSLPSLGLSALI